jgi:DNA-binding CsgD family transcriptional regulator
MTQCENGKLYKEIHALMDVAVSLAELTRFPEWCQEIPNYLAEILYLERLSLAIVRQHNSYAEPELIHHGSSADDNCDSTSHEQGLLAIYAHTLPVWGERDSAEDVTPSSELPSIITVPEFAPFSRAIIYTCNIDPNHRMLLVVHQQPEEESISRSLTIRLSLIARELSKQLQSLIAWRASPESLGVPFNKLTEREWSVLRGLTTDACEKQLAVQLHMSHNTLHSHIKSIYRKTSVQGRLPLLNLVNYALHELRLRTLSTHLSPVLLEDQLVGADF